MIPRTRLLATATTAVLAITGGVLTAAPASAAVTCTSPVWTVQYYANTTLSGTPRLTACDAAISENYGTGDPAGVALPTDNFGVRWSVTRDFGSGGPFTFSASAQDGLRVYLDGVRKIDLWKNVSTTQRKALDLTIPSGKHTVRVDYATWTGAANVGFTYAPRTAATVDTVSPLAPTGLSVAYDRATGKAALRWTANKEMDVTGYRVYRRLSNTGWARVSGSPTLTTTSFTDTPPATGQTFLYEVRAIDRAGHESLGSLDVTATTVDRTGPAAPAALTVTGDAYVAQLRWRAVADAARYEVHAASASAGPYTLLGTSTGPSYEDHDAPPNAPRYYRVRALDALGNPSAFSATATGDGVDRTPWLPPTDLGSVVRAHETQVYWKTPGNFIQEWDNGGHYRVYRSPGTTLDPAALTLVTCAEGSDSTSTGGLCADRGMAAGTYSTYAVTTVDAAGNESVLSDPLTVRSGDRVAPGAVTGLKATPRNDGTLLSWSASAEDDLAGYVAWRGVRRPDGTVQWLDSASCREGTSDPLAVVCPHVPDGETYVFAVVAKDRWGNQLHPTDPRVTAVTATELDIRPSVTVTPEGHLDGAGWGTVVTGPNAPSINWVCTDAALCDPIAGYRVSRWNPVTKAYQPLHAGLLPSATRSYTDDTAEPGNTYFYTFQALREDGTAVATYVWACVRPALV
ncbi:fibronectin type III domain-containing protein [Streptomyces sp. SP18CS02]|uniref:fibronectin type III domain-containing protein n=1 Tax=Streptomyces sp. SP18CS02 TaxID=3002531 RepID=UPI002E77D15C|nr:PA14 domain-containing protein [Streptomyces sp. SP18CS02]MEE1752833.1 PA14 domain-containing protein [Streptomyces sp. SP18CS02]